MRNRLDRTNSMCAVPAVSRWQTREPIRWELVRRMRIKIARGEYETPERMQTALDRILEALRG